MKAMHYLVAAVLVGVLAGRCMALMVIEVVTKERAKALGMEVRVTAAGPDAVRVALEFTPKGELTGFKRVDLEMREGGKLMMSSVLKEETGPEGRVAVSFAADRTKVDKITLRVVVAPEPMDQRGHELSMKDFVVVGKADAPAPAARPGARRAAEPGEAPAAVPGEPWPAAPADRGAPAATPRKPAPAAPADRAPAPAAAGEPGEAAVEAPCPAGPPAAAPAAAPAAKVNPEEEAKFLAAVKKAFADRDAAALEKLTCWDGVAEKQKENLKGVYKSLVEDNGELWDFKLAEPDPKFITTEKEEDGTTLRANLGVARALELIGRRKSDKTILFILTLGVGQKEGKLMFVGWEAVKGE